MVWQVLSINLAKLLALLCARSGSQILHHRRSKETLLGIWRVARDE